MSDSKASPAEKEDLRREEDRELHKEESVMTSAKSAKLQVYPLLTSEPITHDSYLILSLYNSFQPISTPLELNLWAIRLVFILKAQAMRSTVHCSCFMAHNKTGAMY